MPDTPEPTDTVPWKEWCLELCWLLDEIEKKVRAEEWGHVRGMLQIRFQIAEKIGGVKVIDLGKGGNA